MPRLPTKLRVLWARRERRSGSPSWRPPLLLFLFILLFCITAIWVRNHLRPIIGQMAEHKVDYLAAKAINQAVDSKVAEDNIDYGQLIYFEKDIYGQITALKTNMVAVNRLKTGITDEVIESLHNIGHSELSIPLGNLIGGDFLSGRGPGIPIRIVPLGMVEATFSNAFTAAGINQTRHQIMMDITVDISVLFPGYSAHKKVTTQVCIAETIIVGNVPDSYLRFDEGNVFQDTE